MISSKNFQLETDNAQPSCTLSFGAKRTGLLSFIKHRIHITTSQGTLLKIRV